MTEATIAQMTDEELQIELDTQRQWSSDDYFEYTTAGRGDGGQKRDGYMAQLYAEGAKRGIFEPLSPAERDDPDFEGICAFMFSGGYKWTNFMFWLTNVPGGCISFEDAKRQYGLMKNRDTIEGIPGINWQGPISSGRDIDRAVAEETPCPKCGGRCEYESDDSDGSYRAFAVCVDCGNRHEF